MRFFRKTFLIALFWGAPFLQGFHRHHFHAGGISEDHVDCAVCPWTKDVHGTPLVGAAPDLPISLRPFFVEAVPSQSDAFLVFRAFDSRAPPSLPL